MVSQSNTLIDDGVFQCEEQIFVKRLLSFEDAHHGSGQNVSEIEITKTCFLSYIIIINLNITLKRGVLQFL